MGESVLNIANFIPWSILFDKIIIDQGSTWRLKSLLVIGAFTSEAFQFRIGKLGFLTLQVFSKLILYVTWDKKTL